jgi:glycosyltransferase involved in cell wall biosynthesis
VKETGNRPIKILYLMDGFGVGGAEAKLLEMLRHFNQRGYNITLCSFLDMGELKDEFARLGFPLKLIVRKHRFDLTILFNLYRFIRKNRFDVIQTLLFYPDVLGILMGHLAGVPLLVSWETASHYDVFFNKLHRRLFYRFAMKFVSCVVAVSNGTKESLISREKIPDKKIRVIRYGVDLDRFQRKPSDGIKKDLGLRGVFPVLGVVARLDYIKGHTFLIQGIGEIIKKYPRLKCVLVGEGDYRSTIERQIRELGLTEHFELLGLRSDVSELLSALDIFILPSISEGLPNVILEAMACSVPVIASRVGGIPEVIEHRENSLLVPPQNSRALSEAILTLTDDNGLRTQIGENARKRVETHFSLNLQIRQFKTLYQRNLS